MYVNMSVKDGIAKLVRLYTEEESLSEQIKDVKDAIKEGGGDATIAAAVAKSMVKGKTDDLLAKSETTIDFIELARS